MSYNGYKGYLDFLRDAKKNKDKGYFGQSIVIFDDMALEKDQSEIEKQYIMGRKRSNIEGLGCCTFYLSQSWTSIPMVIRAQATLIVIVKVDNMTSLGYILRSVALGATKEQLCNMYEYMRSKPGFGNFLLINANANDDTRIRINFDENLIPDDF
jgi:hypothetical protein